MNWRLGLVAAMLGSLVGCGTVEIRVDNNGPNTIEVTCDPSPDSPGLPVQVPKGESVTLQWKYVGLGSSPFTADVDAVDIVNLNHDDEVVNVDSNHDNYYLTWDGNTLDKE